jgi:hypothetical protein
MTDTTTAERVRAFLDVWTAATGHDRIEWVRAGDARIELTTTDLGALLDERAALLARPGFVTADAFTEADAEKFNAELAHGRIARRHPPLSARLDRIADTLYVSASQIQTHTSTYNALTDQILALRVEADQARATETKAAGR